MNFANRYGPWAVIAGASEGTGREFALQAAARGLNCVLLARREAPLAALTEEIRAASGVECLTASVDLAADDVGERVAAVVGEREVGLFIANAGADPNGALFLDRDIGDWLSLAQRNVLALMRLCHYFGGPMRARGHGGLLLVNSGACYGGGSFMSVYSATKAFELNFGEGLWAELRPQGVDVLNLVLGQTDTPALRQLLADKGLPLPANLASPAAVATMGLDRLDQGPIHNWGQEDAVAGYAPSSPVARRERLLMVDKMSRAVFGDR